MPGTITVHVEWDAALGRTAVVFAALEREGEGVDITSQMLREVRTHWIMTRSALEAVTVDVSGEGDGDRDRIPVQESLSRVLAEQEREPLESLRAAIAVYRVATAISYPPLKLVSDTLKISQSTATRLMTRARDEGLAPEVRIQEPRRAPAVDPYNDPTHPTVLRAVWAWGSVERSATNPVRTASGHALPSTSSSRARDSAIGIATLS